MTQKTSTFVIRCVQGVIISAAMISTAQAADLTEIAPETIASDSERIIEGQTGFTTVRLPSFDPFETQPDIAGYANLVSARDAMSISGEVLSGGAFLDLITLYTTNSNDPYDIMGLDRAYYSSGQVVDVVRFDPRIVECSEKVREVIYDDSYYAGAPYGFIGGIYRHFPRYRGHLPYRYGYGHYGYHKRKFKKRRHFDRHRRDRHRSDRHRSDRDRGDRRDRADRRDRDDRRYRRHTGQPRNYHNEPYRGNRRSVEERREERRVDRRTDRREDRRSDRRADRRDDRRGDRRADRREDRRSDQRRDRRERSHERAVINQPLQSGNPRTSNPNRSNRSDRLRAPREDRGRPSIPVRAERPNVPRPQPQAEPRRETRPQKRPKSETRSRDDHKAKARNNNRARKQERARSVDRHFGDKGRGSRGKLNRGLNFFPAQFRTGYVNRSVSVSYRCAREENLRLHIPQERIEAARFDGLLVVTQDRAGREFPLYIPPNYIQGYLLATDDFVLEEGGADLAPANSPIIYGDPGPYRAPSPSVIQDDTLAGG